ncbi:MAG: hypothetical protein Q7J67_08125, partial [bacterium]|nr:hypothetical protein [bacterium]
MINKGMIEKSSAALPVSDTTAIVKGSVDATKQVRFEVNGLTTGTTRVLTVPDKDITIGDVSAAAALTANALVVGDGGAKGVKALATFGALFPVHYERAIRPARSAVDTVTIYDKTVIVVNGKVFTVSSDTALELNTNATWDTGIALNDAARAGHDYYVYACDNNGALALLVSADSTYPTGYTAATSKKINGFHCLCMAVGTIAGHTLTTFAQGDILPQSVWDLKHRPICEPAGMVWSDEAQIWVDIYLASGTGTSTVSVNGGTISDYRNWMDFVDDFGAVKKQLLDDSEFQLIAAGSNEETNITGSVDPVTTGGHVDTAARRMISNIGCEDCCGVMWQWLRDQSFKSDYVTGWGWYDLPGAKGSLYNQDSVNGRADVKLLAGGHWASAANCGSRCRNASFYRWVMYRGLGGR